MGNWVAEELRDVDLGDERQNRRLVRIVEDLAAQPSASVPQAMRDNAAVQGVYDFWANPGVSAAAIIGVHARRAVERMASSDTVLAIQGTTELDFSNHRATRRVGPISKSCGRGLKVHTVLATNAAGVPLGVLHQRVWARQATRSVDKQRSIAEKESHRWLESLEATQALVSSETQVITVGDREADIYELFALARPANSELLIRAAQNRNTKSGPADQSVQRLFVAIREAPVKGQIELALQRTPRRAARAATLTVRYMSRVKLNE